MRAVVQRVSEARVVIDGKNVGEIGHGIMLLVGFAAEDSETEIDYIIDKTVNLRIFEDAGGKMNLSLADVDGGLLAVPNFTLYGDTRKGRRPGYSSGASPAIAGEIYNRFVEVLKSRYAKVETGVFQAEMKVELINDGPVTLLLDSGRLF
ncbi:MAG: D-aminoacyl-tRNA deacylase [Defluviitaleaceae bacterium]|nr:D-aminoacyl-tRNA deacylase [Defluviitaleaceae bacterium]